MIYREILDHRGEAVSYVHLDTADPDRIHHVITEDVAPLISHARFLSEHLENGSEWKPVAHLPAAVVNQMMVEGSWEDEGRMKKWLNDHANQCFRIWPGRV